jgi:hypothetical protein
MVTSPSVSGRVVEGAEIVLEAMLVAKMLAMESGAIELKANVAPLAMLLANGLALAAPGVAGANRLNTVAPSVVRP